jgi:hypothetical protein
MKKKTYLKKFIAFQNQDKIKTDKQKLIKIDVFIKNLHKMEII